MAFITPLFLCSISPSLPQALVTCKPQIWGIASSWEFNDSSSVPSSSQDNATKLTTTMTLTETTSITSLLGSKIAMSSRW